MVTRKDVADRVGVSVTMVSRVINNSGYVEYDKREAILQAVKELGYHPKINYMVRRCPDSRQIVFLNWDSSSSFSVELYRGMVDYAWQHGYNVFMSGIWGAEKIKSIYACGVILSGEAEAEDYISMFQGENHLPTVSASYGAADRQPRNIPFVESDTYHAMEILLQYLFEKGHRKIAFATPHPVETGNPRGVAFKNRMKPILKDQLEKYLIVNDKKVAMGIAGGCDFLKCGEQLAEMLLQQKTDCTAVACFNDEIAVGMITCFRKKGIRVPEDISVISMDGLRSGSYFYPELTRVSLCAYQQGWECTRILVDMIEKRKVRRKTKIPVGEIIEGTSVKNLKVQ